MAPSAWRWSEAVLLLAALLVAVGLRGWRCADPSYGLNQDEAVNAWNAYCLLKTGRDAYGDAWPLLYYHALGENRSALYLYLLLPGQAWGGLNLLTARLPSLVGGCIHLLLIYWLTRVLFGPLTAMSAAWLLAISPWDLYLSRWGHEGAITGVQTTAVVALLVAVGLIPRAMPRLKQAATASACATGGGAAVPEVAPWSKLLTGLAAGLLAGLSCWGYPALRLFIPLLMLAVLLSEGRTWWRRSELRPLAAGLLLGFAAALAPLAYQHLAYPEVIGRRAEHLWVWSPNDGPLERVAKVAQRYVEHFSPEFLFEAGDAYEVAWPAAYGFYPWAAALPMCLGLIVLVRAARGSAAARLVLLWMLLYPVGDMLHSHVRMALHVLRSATGIGVLTLITAVGIATLAGWLQRRRQSGLLAASVAVLLVSFGLHTAGFFRYLLGERARQSSVYHGMQTDLTEACVWLRPRLEEFDAIHITPSRMNVPYVITLVLLAHDPQLWRSEPLDWLEQGAWRVVRRYGRFHFPPTVAELQAGVRQDPTERVLTLCRPGEFSEGEVLHEVRAPGGAVMLQAIRRIAAQAVPADAELPRRPSPIDRFNPSDDRGTASTVGALGHGHDASWSVGDSGQP